MLLLLKKYNCQTTTVRSRDAIEEIGSCDTATSEERRTPLYSTSSPKAAETSAVLKPHRPPSRPGVNNPWIGPGQTHWPVPSPRTDNWPLFLTQPDHVCDSMFTDGHYSCWSYGHLNRDYRWLLLLFRHDCSAYLYCSTRTHIAVLSLSAPDSWESVFCFDDPVHTTLIILHFTFDIDARNLDFDIALEMFCIGLLSTLHIS